MQKVLLKRLLAHNMKTYCAHLFRADYQHRVESQLMEVTLPIDHAAAVMDFSENITLQALDEIEAAHWAQTQVTLHPIYVVRHDEDSTVEQPKYIKESFVIVSNDLKHDADAVFAFTKLFLIWTILYSMS